MSVAIETVNLTKRFDTVVANKNISIKIEKGSVHAICGENGAGKSTLMNCLYGLYIPSEGYICVDGVRREFKTPKDAISCGVGMVHQHFMLIPTMTVAENIILGKETGTMFKLDRQQAEKEVLELVKLYGLSVDPKALVKDISVGMQQRVEILKALYRGCDILILDEPTAVLAPLEIEELFENIRNLVKKGKTIIIITHKLNEVMDLSDEISVLRLGELVNTVKTSEVSEKDLTTMMVGREVSLGGKDRKETGDHREILSVSHVSVQPSGITGCALKDVSLQVNSGEIVGIAGVDGNGQNELIEAIVGLTSEYDGDIFINSENSKHVSIRQLRKKGIGFIPQDRHHDGLVLDYTIAENMVLGQHDEVPFSKKGLLNQSSIISFSVSKKEEFDIRCAHVEVAASTLSGGNQQKIIIARELSTNPDLIVAMQPTRGLDVGAIEYIHNVLVEARNNNKAVLLVSLELDEVMALSDRIVVMNGGKIVGSVKKDQFDKELIGRMMLGLEVSQ